MSEEIKQFVIFGNPVAHSKSPQMHNAGFDKIEYNGIYKKHHLENANSITRQVEDIQKEAENDLRQEWGNAFDQKVNHAQAALNEFGTPELVEYLESSRLGDNPHLVRTFAKIAESMMEDGSLQGLQADVKTPNQLDHDISTIMAKPEYWDPDSLERPGLIAQVQELMQQKHGTE